MAGERRRAGARKWWLRVVVRVGVLFAGAALPAVAISAVENIGTGVRGVRKGLDGMSAKRTRNIGIAILAEWTTTPDEWQAYEDAWVHR